ncbi:MAG: DUF2752 domain-containing protein [Armatimonadota bacterium]
MRYRSSLALLGAVVIGIVVLICCISKVSRWLPPCPFHLLTGLYCPGCGLTRAANEMAAGHIVAAIRLNVFMMVIIPLIGLTTFIRIIAHQQVRMSNRAAWIVLASMMIFWAARNIPVFPFSLLAPH